MPSLLLIKHYYLIQVFPLSCIFTLIKSHFTNYSKLFIKDHLCQTKCILRVWLLARNSSRKPQIYCRLCFNHIWTASSEFGTYRLCEQRRFRRACASAQSRQNLRCSLIQAVSQEEPSDRKPDPWPLWMAGHAQLKCVMTECSKTQIRLTGPIWLCDNLAIALFRLLKPRTWGKTKQRTNKLRYTWLDL